MSVATLDEQGVIAPCPHCGKRNRIPYARLGETGTCGHCQNTLPAPSAPIDVSSEEQFQRVTTLSKLPVVVDFWAPWCGPCRTIAPELVKVAAANAGLWLVIKADTENLSGVGVRHHIQSIPTMAVFSGGHEISRTSGARPAPAIEQFMRDALNL